MVLTNLFRTMKDDAHGFYTLQRYLQLTEHSTNGGVWLPVGRVYGSVAGARMGADEIASPGVVVDEFVIETGRALPDDAAGSSLGRASVLPG
jgi:hypothetical protein